LLDYLWIRCALTVVLHALHSVHAYVAGP
jgi:hypothetical protein